MAILITKLVLADELQKNWTAECQVSADGKISLLFFCDGKRESGMTFTASDSTALVEFLGPRVKQVR